MIQDKMDAPFAGILYFSRGRRGYLQFLSGGLERMADQKRIIDTRRVRKICGSFSWMDHRFITGGFLKELTSMEILVYFFLVAVSDRYGISFYHDDRICHLLKIDLSSLGQAREGLMQRSLIAYEFPVYQVLQLPLKPVAPPTEEQLAEGRRQKGLFYLQKIKQVVGKHRGE